MRKSRSILLSVFFLFFSLLAAPPEGLLAAEKLAPERPWVGVTIKDADTHAAVGEGAYKKGVLVTDVIKGGPAEEAGISPDDVILGVNGKEVYGVADFATEIRQMSAGTPVVIEVDRGGEIKTVDVVLAQRPAGLFSQRTGAYYTGYAGGGAEGCPKGMDGGCPRYPDMMCPHASQMMTGPHMGMMEDAKYGKMFFVRLFHSLGLTPEQRKQAEALESGYIKKAIRGKADVKVAEVELDELASSEKVDLQKVKAKIDEIAAKKAELRYFRFKSLEDFKKLLTPEQMDKMRKMRMMDGTGMMGHGNMMGMGSELYGGRTCVGTDGGTGYGDEDEGEGATEEPAQAR